MKNRKAWKVFLIMVMAFYPICELTRVIILAAKWYYPEMGLVLAGEVAVMWILYLGIPIVFYKIKE